MRFMTALRLLARVLQRHLYLYVGRRDKEGSAGSTYTGKTHTVGGKFRARSNYRKRINNLVCRRRNRRRDAFWPLAAIDGLLIWAKIHLAF